VQPAAADAGAQDNGSVRFINENGIVSILVDGPLERAPPRAEPEKPAPPPREARDVHRLVVIESAGLIDARSHHIRLAHIEAPSAETRCERPDGVAWPCGMRARTALRRLVRRRAIECLPVKEGEDPKQAPPVRTAVCEVAGTDLSRWLIENGWAEPAGTAPDRWRDLHARAVEERRGLYAPDAR